MKEQCLRTGSYCHNILSYKRIGSDTAINLETISQQHFNLGTCDLLEVDLTYMLQGIKKVGYGGIHKNSFTSADNKQPMQLEH